MPTEQRIVPADTDILCERCGYTLNGLPETSNCPECGEPIASSTSQDGRTLSSYEINPTSRTFWQTTWQVIFQPRRFYRTLQGRLLPEESEERTRRFASRHRLIASCCFAGCAFGHGLWLMELMGYRGKGIAYSPVAGIDRLLPLAALVAVSYALLVGVTRLAQWLTAIEAKFWGIRLPLLVVQRAMRFHSANYLPVGILAALYICGYQILRSLRVVSFLNDTWYIYGACGLVILSAGYLFQTYWIGMKNLMYANR